MKYMAIFGASGFGREVLPLVREQYHEFEPVFVDDNPGDGMVNGTRVLTTDEFLQLDADHKQYTVAVADAAVRKAAAKRLSEAGVKPAEVRASNAVILDEVQIGEGAIICPFSTITSNVEIGENFHSNLYSYVAHDCRIGDNVTFAPAVKCNGNVHVEDDVYIGTGAIIKQGRAGKPTVIGKGAIVGMGAVVTKDVEPGNVVIGNPARAMQN